jgi:hypothetical protein|mmetsp:Transcript_75497/g.214702  ORF Transcript_75497/g.214702 Transcript_75497/m.214702 type:complete len:138 (+) Transcript_75497:317-730(+)
MDDMMANITNSSTATPSAAPTVIPLACDPEEKGSTFLLGVILGLLGSIAINTGNNIQSLGMNQLEEKKRKEVEDAVRRHRLPTHAAHPRRARCTTIRPSISLCSGSPTKSSTAFSTETFLTATPPHPRAASLIRRKR